MIITANCELTTLTDRWYFCEPNKISFTIFGQLHNLLQIIEVQFITKMNKQFKFTENEETESWPRGPTRAGSAHPAFPPACISGPPRGPRGGAAQPASGPRRGKACARRQLCMGTPERFDICYKLYGTILLVYIFTDTPSELLVLSLATPPRPPAHTGATGLAPATHAGHPSPPHPKITSRHSPMREREV